MKVGFFGGSFDPVHRGHVALVRSIQEAEDLDEVILLVARQAPHKEDLPERTSGHHRLAMVQLAFRDFDFVTVDDRELHRDGPSYTVDTMREFKGEREGDELFFLIGMDSLKDLPKWYKIDELSSYVTFLVAGRPGEDGEAAEQCATQAGLPFRVVPSELVDLASSSIRKDLASGGDVSDQIAPEVDQYIVEHELYRTLY